MSITLIGGAYKPAPTLLREPPRRGANETVLLFSISLYYDYLAS
jgi:hypothetical protein